MMKESWETFKQYFTNDKRVLLDSSTASIQTSAVMQRVRASVNLKYYLLFCQVRFG